MVVKNRSRSAGRWETLAKRRGVSSMDYVFFEDGGWWGDSVRHRQTDAPSTFR